MIRNTVPAIAAMVIVTGTLIGNLLNVILFRIVIAGQPPVHSRKNTQTSEKRDY